MSNFNDAYFQNHLNRSMPIMNRAHFGDVFYDLLNKYNDLVAKHNDLVAKYDAFLAHVDAGNVTGIGNTNTASYGASADSGSTVLLPSQR